MSLAITGGRHKGRRLRTDPASRHVRPTSGKVREALFSILAGWVEDCTFVDLFAGSGSVGLEALSRGAREVHFVEENVKTYKLLQENCAAVEPEGMGRSVLVHRATAADFSRKCRDEGRTFDIVFADPPFSLDFEPILEMAKSLAAPDGWCVVQFPSRTPPAWVAAAEKVKEYGESGMAFFRV